MTDADFYVPASRRGRFAQLYVTGPHGELAADPANDIVFVGMFQRMVSPASPNIETLSRPLVYQALVDPRK